MIKMMSLAVAHHHHHHPHHLQKQLNHLIINVSMVHFLILCLAIALNVLKYLIAKNVHLMDA
jgi:hypothetical protein